MKAVSIVDYGMGNLRSLAMALERAGATVTISDDPLRVAAADRVVIPGQGQFGRAMERIASRGLLDGLRAHVEKARPLLGVCLGLQVLYEGSEEAPGIAGLGAIRGTVELLAVGPGLKRPHMGWAPVDHQSEHPVLAANTSGEAFYFVHSYGASDAPGFERATCTHGAKLIAAVAKDAVVATQFHPEKSQDAGDRLLRAWLSI